MTAIEPTLALRLEEIEKRLGSYRTQCWRSAWVVTAVFLIVLALIIAGALFFIPASMIATAQSQLQPLAATAQTTSNATVGGEGDFIKVVIPLLAVAFGFAVGFLGLKRLEQFDSEINGLRSSLQNQLLEERRLAATDRDRLVKTTEDRFADARRSQSEALERIEKRQSELKLEMERAAAQSLNEIKEERSSAKIDRNSIRQEMLDELTRKAEEVASSARSSVGQLVGNELEPLLSEASKDVEKKTEAANLLLQEINLKLQQFGWLKQHVGSLDSFVAITSAGVAHKKALELFQAKQIDAAVKLAKLVIESKCGGSEADFHNLGLEFARNDYHDHATEIVKVGLLFFPSNIDLIADGIKYATCSGQMNIAEELAQELLSIDSVKWNWRSYVFLADYYKARGDDEKSLEVYEQFRSSSLSTSDERGYSESVEFFERLGDLAKAEQFALEGLQKCVQAPQCAFHLAKLKLEQGKCTDAVRFASIALSQNIADQPTVNMSSIIWYRGAARVKYCLQLASMEVIDVPRLEREAILAAKDLSLSVAMPRIVRQHEQEAAVQMQLLRQALAQVGSDQVGNPIFQDLKDKQAALMTAIAQMMKAREQASEE
ncbi:MAG: hypothetical protein JNK37_15840 [Verrucomicrobiales bacterium]|nr:hypothetical protein [Verrucomicrobiales bacterium]